MKQLRGHVILNHQNCQGDRLLEIGQKENIKLIFKGFFDDTPSKYLIFKKGYCAGFLDYTQN